MSFTCAISGEAAQNPVVSTKSGLVYERRLIETYISENGSEPSSGQPLTVEDLLELRTQQTVRPRPPTQTSIPALLGVFQQEWDSLALEVYNLQQNLVQTRQELSTALYQNDAAVRVIARLTKERDDARDALSRVNAGASQASGTNGDAMHVDNTPLPEAVITKIEETQKALMKSRKKRPVPAEWATPDVVSSFTATASISTSSQGATFLASNKSNGQVAIGGQDGAYGTVSTAESTFTLSGEEGEPLSAGLWAGSRMAIATASGKVKIIENGQESATFAAHNGRITCLSVHPSGDLLASVSSDKSYVLYDLESNSVLTQVYTNSELTCTRFHPDGHLLATANAANQIQIFDIKNGTVGGTFELESPAMALAFSENGYWLASANSGSSIISIWDLRKVGDEALAQKLECGSPVLSLDWDYTAQFLLAGGPGGVVVKQYTKSSKSWSEPLRTAVQCNLAAWGENAQSIVCADSSGKVTVLAAA